MTIARTLLGAALCAAPLPCLPAQGYAVVATPVAKATAKAAATPDLLDRAVAAWAKVRTIRATFDQTIVNPLTGTSQHATGTYLQRRPGKLAVQFDAPYEDRIVADGAHLWLYLPSSAPGQVIRTRQDANGAGSMDISAQFMSAPKRRYEVSDAGTLGVNGRPSHGFTLVPRAGTTAPFKSAIVYVDDASAEVRQFVVTETSGVQRTVRLTSYKVNAPVEAKAFTFVTPTGVRVVER